MVTPPRSREKCELAWDTWKQYGEYAKAAKALGWNERTLSRYVKDAERYGWRGLPVDVPEGFEVRSQGVTVDKHGEVSGQSVKMVPHLAQEYEPIDGLELRARTVQTDGEGRVTQTWHKEARNGPTASQIMAMLKESMRDYESPVLASPAPETSDISKLFVIPCSDWHIGSCYNSVDKSLAWGSEDTIADIRKACFRLLSSAPKAETCLIQGLGDLCDYDSCLPVTPKNRHILETDLSPLEMIDKTLELLVWLVETALHYFGKVVINMVRGNHDETLTLCILAALRAHFREEPRVMVDFTDDPFNMVVHGEVMFFAAHGDDLKAGQVPGFMASNYPEAWGQTRRRIAITGHRHHKEKLLKEESGVEVISLPAMVRSNRYARTAGYVSGRGMQSLTIDKSGDIETNQVDFR